MTTPRFITRTEFEAFKQNEASNALSVIDIHLKNENKLNQFAARALGWSSFEALEVQLRRADQCQHSFLIEHVTLDGIPYFLVRANNRMFWINCRTLVMTTRESFSADFIAPPMHQPDEHVVSHDTHPVDEIVLTDAGDSYATFVATVKGEQHALCFARK